MPKPELASIIVNAETCHKRTNNSWILSRILRDFDLWRHPDCDRVEASKLAKLQEEERERAEMENRQPRTVRIGLRVTVWDYKTASGSGTGDPVYWAGLIVSLVQLSIAAIPWAIWDEWLTFLITASGTILAYASGSLPQWVEEKSGVRKLSFKNPKTDTKAVYLTEGNGAHEAILIVSRHGCIDLEALAAPQRLLRMPQVTRICCALLAVLWLALLICVAGYDQHTWFLLGVGVLGMLHNAAVCAWRRYPTAFGIELGYQQTIAEGKVMQVLHEVETRFPQAGAALLDEFFSGDLTPREELLWRFARIRFEAWKSKGRLMDNEGMPDALLMPSLQRPTNATNDLDIPLI
jgi:hypothetical protein